MVDVPAAEEHRGEEQAHAGTQHRGRPLAFSEATTQLSRTEHERANDDRSDGRDQHCACRHILGLAGHWMEVRRGRVEYELERSVERLSRTDPR